MTTIEHWIDGRATAGDSTRRAPARGAARRVVRRGRGGSAARRFQRGVRVGMIGINVPIPVPMAYYSFGGRKDSLFGQSHIYGPDGVAFSTRARVVTSRWPYRGSPSEASLRFPTAR